MDQNCPPIWHLHTKRYKGVWNVSANNSETVGYKDLRFGQIVYILVFYNILFLGFCHWTVSNLFFCAVFIANSGKEEWAGFFSLDKERPKLPFNSLSPSYCEVYSCFLLFIVRYKKNKIGKKERKKTTENIKLFQLLALITSLCKGANDH